MISGAIQRLRFLIEDQTGRFFPAGRNPFYFLGALSFFFFWIVLASGTYLFLFYRLNIDGAYDSIQSLSNGQPYWGGIIRSLHRYAADGLMITMVLHGLRVFLAGQYRFARWLAWVSGIIVIGVLWVEGILGYWMVWDNRAQFVALKSAEFLDILPIFGVSLPRAFLSRDLITNLFFLIIIALHIVLPIIALVVLWLHVSRITKPVINPARSLMLGVFFILLILSVLNPAKSGLRADPQRLPLELPLDWFYLSIYPVFTALPAGWVWLLFIAGGSLLVAIPWLGSPKRPEPVSLVLKRCNACTRCYEDCPYEAISMRPRTDGRNYNLEAWVDPGLCVSCGICLGSCSTAALELADTSLIRILTGIRKRRLQRPMEESKGQNLIILCERALTPDGIQEAEKRIQPVLVPCIGAIHPKVIEQTWRTGVKRIFLAGCADGDCQYRTGNRWLLERLGRKREPFFKETVNLSKVQTAGFTPARTEEALAEMELFQKGLTKEAPVLPGFQTAGWIRSMAAGLLLAFPALWIFALSGRPSYAFFKKEESLLVISLKYTASPRHCRPLKEEELQNLPEHMRTPLECSRERWPVRVRFDLDGQKRLDREYPPTGLWSDGPVYVYEKFKLKPGTHDVRLILQETPNGSSRVRSEQIDLKPGQAFVLDIAAAKP